MSDPDRDVWEGMLGYLRTQHPTVCRQWFDEIEPLGIHAGVMHLRAHSAVHKEYLRRSCTDVFREALQSVTGRLLGVRFFGPGESVDDGERVGPSSRRSDAHGSLNGAAVAELEPPDTLAINPDYDFSSFVVGPSNRYAHAAAMAVAEQPGSSYNPLFIHGDVGLGKTHLLQAVCLTIRRNNPEAVIHYLSCESFVTYFTEAIRANQMAQFRHWFRDVDVLVLDDIHFLASRERSQEEFFHTFNTLYQANKQIVLSSDAPPEEIPSLEDRVVSRFKCGLVTQVEAPDLDTRIAIVQSKAKQRGLDLPDDAACHVATRVTRNIRELEGAVTKLQIAATVEGRPIDLELALEVIGGEPRSGGSGPTIQLIAETVADFFNVRLTDLQGKRKPRSIAQPRQIGMFLARRHTRHSLEEIGGFFGGRDHTTVIHAIKTIEGKATTDQQLSAVLTELEQKVVKVK